MFRFISLRIACTLALAAAADGQVLIDQKSVLTGRVTPGDTPGFPLTLSQPGIYRLTGNITLPNDSTSGIKITGDNVTVDLNGFSIIGPVVCSSSPAVCPAPTQAVGIDAFIADGGGLAPRATRILNGTVRGIGGTGILMNGAGNSVENVNADSNARGGILAFGRVVNSSATLNGSFGIFAVTVRGSTATGNHSEGIQLDASGGIADGNIVSFNGPVGIRAPNATVTGNTIVRITASGLWQFVPAVLLAIPSCPMFRGAFLQPTWNPVL